MTAGSRLRSEIRKSGLVRLMATHSPLSAIIAEEAGFDGLWASGFELSALYGLPDASLISLSQHLDMTRAIVMATALPVIADIDTGYGNANNVQHCIRSYEQAGAAGIVMEDKIFPKSTSLYEEANQKLLRPKEFQGKIRAATDARKDPDFLIIARTEAFIAGLGEDEALSRANQYEEAGADMVLVHSKKKDVSEIEGFIQNWAGRIPIVLIPTSYPELTYEKAHSYKKVAMMIYGNHGVRACVQAMRATFSSIIEQGSSLEVEPTIATVKEVFDLQRMDEVTEAEGQYLR